MDEAAMLCQKAEQWLSQHHDVAKGTRATTAALSRLAHSRAVNWALSSELHFRPESNSLARIRDSYRLHNARGPLETVNE